MLSVNYNVSRSVRGYVCELCDMGVIEDVVHFVGTCPVLRGVPYHMAMEGLYQSEGGYYPPEWAA